MSAQKGKARKIFGKIGMIFTGTVTGIFVTASLLLSCCLAADWVAEESARTLPPYAREDISALLAKDVWSEEDYAYLYKQTGLGKAPLDELKSTPERILEFQDALFFQPQIAHIDAAITTPHEVTVGYRAPIAPLQAGDVLITSSCHTYGWRNGHAALVTDATNFAYGDEHVMQSIAPGYVTSYENSDWFRASPNFLVLRLKDVNQEKRAEIGAFAEENLMGIPYSLTVGVLSKKDQGATPKSTHCGHFVWQAYKIFGYDIDSNGGAVVTPQDIANSPLFEVVQVYGFDPEKLWS